MNNHQYSQPQEGFVVQQPQQMQPYNSMSYYPPQYMAPHPQYQQAQYQYQNPQPTLQQSTIQPTMQQQMPVQQPLQQIQQMQPMQPIHQIQPMQQMQQQMQPMQPMQQMQPMQYMQQQMHQSNLNTMQHSYYSGYWHQAQPLVQYQQGQPIIQGIPYFPPGLPSAQPKLKSDTYQKKIKELLVKQEPGEDIPQDQFEPLKNFQPKIEAIPLKIKTKTIRKPTRIQKYIPSPTAVLKELSSYQMGEGLNQQNQLTKNVSKNIPKNCFKGLVKYIMGKKAEIKTHIIPQDDKLAQFYTYVKKHRTKVLTMQQFSWFLRSADNPLNALTLRIMSDRFFNRDFVAYLYNSKIQCKSEHMSQLPKLARLARGYE